MARSGRILAVVSLLAFFAGSSALAGERGLVANSGGMMKAEPKPKGKKVDKLKQGTMVDVIDHSPDGLWVKVAVSGPDGNQEGWVEKSYVRSLSRYGFSWERKDKGGGTQSRVKPAATPAQTPAEVAAEPVPTPAESGWGTEQPAEESAEGWSNETPAADPAATPEEGGWGEEAAPAATATPAPAEGEGDWGAETEVDLTQ